MPFQIGGVAIHSDVQHIGSAKRNRALGVAGLDAAGKPIDTSANVAQTKDEKDAASGYAGLNAGAKVPDANLESPVGTHAALAATHGRTNIDGVTERNDAIAAHEADLTAVHGINNTNQVYRFTALSVGTVTRNTIYQNTDSTLRTMIVNGSTPGGVHDFVDIGSTSPPATQLWDFAGSYSLTFLVPPSWYWRLRNAGESTTTPAVTYT